MNLLVSHNWLKEYLAAKEPAEVFARKISLCGPSVERSYPQAPLFENMFVGQVVAVRPHPNADKLRLVMTDLGKKKLEFVCGGINLSVGMKVAAALAGAKVRWHGQGGLAELKPVEIRGVKSEGMICAAGEIGLADAFPHPDKEILDLSWCKSRPGTPLARALGLDDTVFDIEVTSNRPDAFSIIGLAREAAAILGDKFTWKEPVVPSVARSTKPRELAVRNTAPRLCGRYQAVVMDNIHVGPSPWWVKNRLRLAGLRPINNIVDITNYVLIEYGQPMHAFDLEKIGGASIIVREAKAGEKMKLLDGREVDLAAGQLVIADDKRPMAVAGVMGGEDSGVTETAKTIVFESASFDPVSIRRTARALNAQTDSSLRFEKGLPEEQTQSALARAVELCQEIACGRVASPVFDSYPAPRKRAKFQFRPVRAEALIGVDIPAARMVRILKSLGFGVSARMGGAKNPRYEVTVPYWRERDIEGERDFTEEIARIYGYHNLPPLIPPGEIPVEAPDAVLTAQDQAKRFFAAAGFTELISYSLISRDLFGKCGLDAASALRVANPLSADFELMRTSLVPGVLAAIKQNEGEFPAGSVFEASGVYLPRTGAELPEERPYLLAAAYGPDKEAEQRFRRMKGVLEAYARHVGLRDLEMKRSAGERPLWHPGRSAVIVCGGREIGMVGEIHPAVCGRFGLDARVTTVELDLNEVLRTARPGQTYNEPPQFPPVRRDLAFILDEATDYADVAVAVRQASDLIRELELFDIFRGPVIGEKKRSLAMHLTLGRDDRTLTAEEAEKELEAVKRALADKFGATLRA